MSKHTVMDPTRRYSAWSLILMFFIFSLTGWLWEGTLSLAGSGLWINRGILHGPYLPIYGFGSDLILVLLRRFRDRPCVELVLSITLCGLIEYLTACILEYTHGGLKWWDYSGYFLNIQGRICAVSLLLFGMAGIFVIYVAAPVLDHMICQIPIRWARAAACMLLGLFCFDLIVSIQHPNMGPGITVSS